MPAVNSQPDLRVSSCGALRRPLLSATVMVLILPLVAVRAQTVDYVLDLRNAPRDPPIAQDISPATGDAVVEIQGLMRVGYRESSVTKKAPLALEVRIQKIWPLSVRWNEDVQVDLLVRNAGKEPVAIPASRRDREILSSGRIGRTRLHMLFKLSPSSDLA